MRASILLSVLVVACGGMDKSLDDGSELAAVADAVAERPARKAVLDWEPLPEAVELPAPMRLTASDGSGLVMSSLWVESVVVDPLVFTELKMSFDNPEDRVLEGRFEITLPPGAAISRFAMRIDDKWQEGEVVEKQAARRAYEDFLHRRQDPALLEKDAGNQFRARVFPIPARGTKDLILSYSQELRGADEPYQVMLRGLPRLNELHARVQVESWDGEPEVFEVSEKGFVPDRDLRVVFNESASAVGLRSGNLGVARVAPILELPPEPVTELSVLFDTSASRALGFADSVARLDVTLDALVADQGDFEVSVWAFDQEVVQIYRGKAGKFGEEQRAILVDRGAMGASNLDAALSHMTTAGVSQRLMLVTDGVVTAGEDDAHALRERVAKLEGAGVQRLDVLVDGGIRDAEMLSELVTGGLPHDGVVAEATEPGAVVAKLTGATRSGIEVSVPGATWVWPDTLHGVQSGDEVLVYAELPADQPMGVELHGASMAPSIAYGSTSRPLLQRAAAQANIERLTHLRALTEDEGRKSELAEMIVTLSTSNRVLSDLTALLILETEEDYEQYGIARNGLADILTVGPKGLQLMQRKTMVVTPEPPVNADKKKRAEKTRDDDDAPMDDDDGKIDEDVDYRTLLDDDDGGQAMHGEDLEGSIGEELEALGYVDEITAGVVGSSIGDQGLRGAGAGGGGEVRVASPGPAVDIPEADPEPMEAPTEEPLRIVRGSSVERRGNERPQATSDAWNGPFAEIMYAIRAGKLDEAQSKAEAWRASDPGAVLALVALGEVYEARKQPTEAARAYGSIIDLFPSRADLRRMAGERLERLGSEGMDLAADTYRYATEQRADHPSSHRLYAYALSRLGRHEQAYDAIVAGHQSKYPAGRFAGVDMILAEDVGLVAAAWAAAEPAKSKELKARVAEVGGVWPEGPSVRFILYWETDANDVDFHIYDSRGGHAFYSQPQLRSGGNLYADVTTGYGPECFTIRNPKAHPYTLQAHYYSRGPMGYGMGMLQVMRHDGAGKLTFEARPYVIMEDGATVGLGTVAD